MAKIQRAKRLRELPFGRRYIGIVADLRGPALSDSSVAILGGSLADMVLFEALEAYRMRRDPDADDGFPRSIPREFGRRIEVGARANLFGQWVYEDLDVIREIRDVSAHGVEPFEFTDPRISVHADGLHFAASGFRYEGRRAPESARERFVHVVEWVTDLLLTDARRRSRGMRGASLMKAGGPASVKK